ncbi:MAG: TIGR00269 family protein [Candidatus Woesearchaeota archaeon]
MDKKLSNSKFVEYVEKKVRDTIRRYKLFNKNDRIAVAVSGGKDSTVCLYILKKLGYDVEAITIDAKIGDYTKKNIENLKKVCKEYKIKLNIVSFRDEFGMSLCYIRDLLHSKDVEFSSCMICGILKRYLLNKHSKKLRYTHLATGHNLDDEAQSFVMNVFRNDFKLAKRQGPFPGLTRSKKFVQRVKPLYFIKEDEVIRYSKIMRFPVNYGICPCSVHAYRRDYRQILDRFEKDHPSVKYNILKFQENMKLMLKDEDQLVVNGCRKCGEPCSKDICRACIIFDNLKLGKKEKINNNNNQLKKVVKNKERISIAENAE